MDRILLSDRHYHDLRLSEQEIGILIDALRLLTRAALDEEGYKLVKAIDEKLRESLNKPVSYSTVPEAEEREWRKFLNRTESDTYHI